MTVAQLIDALLTLPQDYDIELIKTSTTPAKGTPVVYRSEEKAPPSGGLRVSLPAPPRAALTVHPEPGTP